MGWKVVVSYEAIAKDLDDQGRFEITGLKAGRYSLRIMPKKHSPLLIQGLSLERTVILGTDEQRQLDVEVQQSALLGTVTGADGQPAADHRMVIAGKSGGGWTYRTVVRTQPDGRYRVSLPAGTGQLKVIGPKGQAWTNYVVSAGADRELDVQLSQEGGFYATIELADGAKMPNYITLSGQDEVPFYFYCDVSSGGEVSLGQIKPGRYVVGLMGGSDDQVATPASIEIPEGGLVGQRFLVSPRK